MSQKALSVKLSFGISEKPICQNWVRTMSKKEKVATVWEHTAGREVVGLEGPLPPGAEGPALAQPVGFRITSGQQLPRLILSSSASFSAWPDWTSGNRLCTASSILPTTGNTQGPSAAVRLDPQSC